MTAREAISPGTRGGAPVLGRDDVGSLEPGRQADLAVWSVDRLELAGAADPVAGSCSRRRTGSTGSSAAAARPFAAARLVRADESEIARIQRLQARRFAP